MPAVVLLCQAPRHTGHTPSCTQGCMRELQQQLRVLTGACALAACNLQIEHPIPTHVKPPHEWWMGTRKHTNSLHLPATYLPGTKALHENGDGRCGHSPEVVWWWCAICRMPPLPPM